jgi:hypothetical protein
VLTSAATNTVLQVADAIAETINNSSRQTSQKLLLHKPPSHKQPSNKLPFHKPQTHQPTNFQPNTSTLMMIPVIRII